MLDFKEKERNFLHFYYNALNAPYREEQKRCPIDPLCFPQPLLSASFSISFKFSFIFRKDPSTANKFNSFQWHCTRDHCILSQTVSVIFRELSFILKYWWKIYSWFCSFRGKKEKRKIKEWATATMSTFFFKQTCSQYVYTQ